MFYIIVYLGGSGEGRVKLTGAMYQTLTGLPPCIPGLNAGNIEISFITYSRDIFCAAEIMKTEVLGTTGDNKGQ